MTDDELCDRLRAMVAAISDGQFNELDAVADKWFASNGVQRMVNAIASVFEVHAPQEIMDRFRDKIGALLHLAFVEGAGQGALQFAPLINSHEDIAARIEALSAQLARVDADNCDNLLTLIALVSACGGKVKVSRQDAINARFMTLTQVSEPEGAYVFSVTQTPSSRM